MRIQPLFIEGDKVFVTINNIRTGGIVISYPHTPIRQYTSGAVIEDIDIDTDDEEDEDDGQYHGPPQEFDDLGSSTIEDYSGYYDATDYRHHKGIFSSDGMLYGIHYADDWIVYLVRLSTDHVIQVDQEELVRHPAYGVLSRSAHDFLSRRRTNGLKQYSDLDVPILKKERTSKVYLPDEVNKYVTSFLPPSGQESLSSHINNRITHTRRANIRKSRKIPSVTGGRRRKNIQKKRKTRKMPKMLKMR